MRIVVWNCNMAFHKKWDKLMGLNPDIAIIPECASLEILLKRKYDGPINNFIWRGFNPHKGLAVLARDEYGIKSTQTFDERQKIVYPVSVRGKNSFNLLAVWSNTDRDLPVALRGKGPVLRSLDVYREFCSDHPLVVAGDFNHNVIWDKSGRADNHAEMLSVFDSLGLVSAYHVNRSEVQGSETEPTIYWRNRTLDGPKYHIDYIFIPRAWVQHIVSVSLGGYNEWVGSGLSDHVPLIVDLDFPQKPS